MRLLVVDDNAVFREELTDFLESEGHHVAAAPSVAAAIEQLEGAPFDLVLTDLRMPRQSGLDLLRVLRERWPAVLAVMITGKAGVDTAVEAMKLGAFDYIAKPFRTDQVREMLKLAAEERSFLDRSGQRRGTDEVLGELAASGTPVLVASAMPPAPRGTVAALVFDGQDLARLRDAALAFLAEHPEGGLVLPEADRMLRGHRIEDVVALLTDLRDRLDGRGPLVLGFDPKRVPAESAAALRAVVSGPAVHDTLEAMANPIRRRILGRLEAGPASFTETMRAAGLEDSPKMSFHLHRLSEVGLIARTGDEYRITPTGASAIATLHAMERSATEVGRHDFVFLTRPAARPPASVRSRSGAG